MKNRAAGIDFSVKFLRPMSLCGDSWSVFSLRLFADDRPTTTGWATPQIGELMNDSGCAQERPPDAMLGTVIELLRRGTSCASK